MKWALSLLALCVVSVSSPIQAQVYGQSFDARNARDARERGDVVPLRDIFADLKRRFGGYQLDAKLSRDKSEYYIDWMSGEGRRMKLVVSAKSGRIIRQSGG